MKKIRRYTIALIIFSIAAMSNKTISMELKNKKLTIQEITFQNEKQTKNFLDNYFKTKPSHLSYIEAGSGFDFCFWWSYSLEYKRSRMINALLNNKNNLNILDNENKEIIGFANISYESRLSPTGLYTSTNIKNLIITQNSTQKTNTLNALVNKFFNNSTIDTIEYSKTPDKSEFLTKNGFTLVDIDSSSVFLPYYVLSREKYNTLKE